MQGQEHITVFLDYFNMLTIMYTLHKMIEIYCVISGRVQNVRFRDYVQVSATELEIFGWVKNLSDGTVEVVAQGSPDILKEFVEYLHEGSLLSQVEAVSVDWRTEGQTLEDFAILH